MGAGRRKPVTRHIRLFTVLWYTHILKNATRTPLFFGRPALYAWVLFAFCQHLSIAGSYISLTLALVLSVMEQPRILASFLKWPGDWNRLKSGWLVLVAVSLLAVIPASSRLEGLRSARHLLLFLLIPLLGSWLDHQPRPEKARATLLGAILLSTGLSASAGLFQALTQGVTLQARLKGFSSHWMTFSGLLMLSLVFFLALRDNHASQANQVHPLLFRGVCGLASLALLLSLTRSAWLGFLAGLGLLLFKAGRRRWLFLLLLIPLLGLWGPTPISKRIQSFVDPHNPSNRDRIAMAYTTAHIIQAHPWLGVGLHDVPRSYEQYRPSWAVQNNPHMHNNFLQMLAERGILGLTAYLILWATWLGILLGRKKGSLPPPWRRTLLAVILAFTVSGLFEYNFGDSEILMFLLLLNALAPTKPSSQTREPHLPAVRES